MMVDQALRRQLETIFRPLRTAAAAKSFPSPGALSESLGKVAPVKGASVTVVPLEPKVAAMFATAAIEMWLRAVHSFLISASLTEASPIWAATSGYYSSHYSVRAFGHVLGVFQLYHRKWIARLNLSGGKHVCSFDAKQANDREHRFYWKLLKNDAHFVNDPLFTFNDSTRDAADAAHREHANYSDHLHSFPNFRPLDAQALKDRVQFISELEFNTPPIPRRSRFPDTEAVQIVGYHRVVTFRRLLDEVLGTSNRFWTVHRQPGWASDYINFQLTEQATLSSLTLS